MKAAVFYATYGHWTQSLINSGFQVAYHYQPRLDIDPDEERMGWVPDPLAKKILNMNFMVDFRPPSANDEAYDLMVGSPPCVGYSRANPKASRDHPLNKHTFNFFKWVALNGPKYFLMEMVPGLLLRYTKADKEGKSEPSIFQQCLPLISEDYCWDTAILNAADYGAAQTRQRLYVWGSRRDLGYTESPLCSIPRKSYTPIGTVIDEDFSKIFDDYKPDGHLLMSLYRKDGKKIAGAWGSLTPKKIANRTLKKDGLMFTITGTSVRDCLHYNGKRLLSIPELKVLMGFPVRYNLPLRMNAGLASKVIASGVDVRFASYLLNHIKMVLEA